MLLTKPAKRGLVPPFSFLHPPSFAGQAAPRAFAPVNDDILWSFSAVFLSVLLLGLAVFSHILHPVFAATLTFIMAGAMSKWMPGIALVAVIFAAIFQNIFVSLISPLLVSESDFNIARGYSFIILAAVWLVAFLRYFLTRYGQDPALDKIMRWTTIVFILIGVYFLLGFVKNPLGAIIYLRNIGSAFMFFQVGLIFCATFPLRLSHALALICFLLILCGYIEFFYRNAWIEWTHAEDYWNLSVTKQREAGLWDQDAAERGIVTKGFIDSITVVLFNTPLLEELKIRVTRLLGPNFHAISYAYVITFFLLFSAYRGAFVSAVLLVPLLIFANAKGAIILFVLVAGGWLLARLFGARIGLWGLGGVLVAYVGAGIIIGLHIGDFHVLGFMGGVFNFLANPFGHGLGAGGNLSTNFSTLDWSEYQALGRTPIAIESAVGVLLFQMGGAAFFYLGVSIWIAFQTVFLAARTGFSLHLAAGFALLVVLVNGIFQEEALFSPVAFGLILGLNGMILGAAIRTGAMR